MFCLVLIALFIHSRPKLQHTILCPAAVRITTTVSAALCLASMAFLKSSYSMPSGVRMARYV